MPISAEDIRRFRDVWKYRGKSRPSFAQEPNTGQESVWDYPRPPSLTASTRQVLIKTPDGERTIVNTTKSLRMCETASPPTWYVSWTDVDTSILKQAPSTRSSFCEWKGAARYWKLNIVNAPDVVVAWDYPTPLKDMGYEDIANMVGFYPGLLQCFVDGERVRPQAGSFYAGWITNDVVGPFKGDPGTQSW